MTRSIFSTKLARFQEDQERKRKKPMTKHIRSRVIQKLTEELEQTKDPKLMVSLGNVLAKFLPPQTKSPRKKPDPIKPQQSDEANFNELIEAFEKKRRQDAKAQG